MRFFSPSLPFLALALGCFTTLGFSGGRLAAQGTAKTVSIGWNANPEPDIAGYRIHIGTGTGTGSGALAETMTVGTTPAADLAGLASDTTYHCAVLAFNSAGLESPLSQEISFTTAAATAELPEISVEQLAGPALVDGQGAVSLGSTVVGSAGITTEFLVKNVGTAPLTGLALVVDGPDFSAASLGATSLAPGASATVELTFRPVAAGNRAGSLFIASNDADENPFRIALSGTGVGVPEISVQHPAGVELTDGTAAVNFSNSDLGSTGPAEIITIRNAGTASLTGLTVVSGSSEFIASQPASGTLAPGTSTTFQIAFKPTAAGTRTATLQITSNDADENPFDISLVGNGVAYPEIAVERANGTALSDGAATVNLGSVALAPRPPLRRW